MDSITFDTRKEYRFFKKLLIDGKPSLLLKPKEYNKADSYVTEDIPYIWTGGRKCNFKGCERKDLQPAIINGWFWAPTNKRIPNKRRCKFCDWSRTGGYDEISALLGG